ncbi:MAG: phosphoribosylanthranilate isomerase [Elusimicrobia bacterium]|nr:phosphoribosylanthranilate isomerase [Elusimicrobiota bacterium]
MRIKICGVTTAGDAYMASSLGAWAVGLIFVPSSPRALDVAAARLIRSAIGPDTLAIGVFQDAEPAFIQRAISACRLDAVQLHGSETPEACASAAVPVYKGVPLASAADLAALDPYAGRVAGFLVETVRRLPAGREAIDERERRARWALVRQAGLSMAVILAGELTPENVGEAVRLAEPAGVDVCGGVEASPGLKDPGKLKAFFDAVRAVERT